MNKLRDWFNKTPTVDGPTKEELRKANARITHFAGGGSSVERPPKPPLVKNTIPSHWNKEIKEENPTLDLIHSYKVELDKPYISSIFIKDLLYMLDEIENSLKED